MARFKKGYIPWNKGLTKETHPSIARTGFKIGHLNYNKGHKHTEETKKLLSAKLKGRPSPMKGVFTEGISYSGIHKWIVRSFGRANKCENKDCISSSKIFDWAKLKDKEYLHLRENYIMLCRRCHLRYDRKKNNEDIRL